MPILLCHQATSPKYLFKVLAEMYRMFLNSQTYLSNLPFFYFHSTE